MDVMKKNEIRVPEVSRPSSSGSCLRFSFPLDARSVIPDASVRDCVRASRAFRADKIQFVLLLSAQPPHLRRHDYHPTQSGIETGVEQDFYDKTRR